MTNRKEKKSTPATSTVQATAELLQHIKESGDLPKTKLDKEFSVWVRVLLQNWRQGTVACKGREMLFPVQIKNRGSKKVRDVLVPVHQDPRYGVVVVYRLVRKSVQECYLCKRKRKNKCC